jgi:hypothetical protein
VSSGEQPIGARLDEAGNRLWSWTGRGYLEEFYSVTTMIGGGIPKHLQNWYAKLVAELAYADVERHGADALDHWATEGRAYIDELRANGRADETPKGLALRYLKGAAERERDAAARRGSEVHDEAEAHVLKHAREGARFFAETHELPVWPDEIAPKMASFDRFLRERRPIYLYTEANVFSRTRSYAGRADAFLRAKVPDDWTPPPWISRPFVWEQDGGPPGWLTLCTDYKSGREIYHEVAAQTAAYANGDFIGGPDRVTELPIPRVDSGAVLHLTPTKFRFEAVGPMDHAFRVFLYAREIFLRLGRRPEPGGDPDMARRADPAGRRRRPGRLAGGRVMGDACSRCNGRGQIPKVPGDYRVMVRCGYCRGTGRRGG